MFELSFERRARGDFRSTASGLGFGPRVYLMGRRFASFDGPSCVGLFFGVMGSFRVVGVRESDDHRLVGRATRGSVEAQLGFRMPIRRHAEISVLGVAAVHTDFVGGLAVQLRPSLSATMTLGALF